MVFDTVEGAVQHYVAAGYPKDVTNLIEWVTKPLLQSPIVSVGTIVTKNPVSKIVNLFDYFGFTTSNYLSLNLPICVKNNFYRRY